MKKIIATVAMFAAIAPNAMLSAQVSQAAPNDDPTTTVVPAPGGGDGHQAGGDGHSGPGDGHGDRQAPADTPAPQAPASPQAPVSAPPGETATPSVPQPTPVEPTTTTTTAVEAPHGETPTVTPTPQEQRTSEASTSASAPPQTSTQTSASDQAPAVATTSSSPTTSGSASPTESHALNTPLTSASPLSTTLESTTVVSNGNTVTEVAPAIVSASASVRAGTRVEPQPDAVPVKSAEAIEAAKAAPAVLVDPHAPPPPPANVTNVTNIDVQVNNIEQVDIHGNTNNNVSATNWRPARWDYVDYDRYRRPVLYNPSGEDVRYRYYYDGDYREAWVPPGQRIVLDIVEAAVFPFTAVGSSFVSSGSFNGGGWTPPSDDYDGPPPPDWQPYTPVTYDNAYVDVPAANQSLFVNQVTSVGHDDSQPVGQQDSFLLDGTTLGRGQISPDGRSITLATAQKTPGVGPVTNGVDLVNMATPLAPASDYTPYYIGAALALAAAMGGLFWWVWRRPKGIHHVGDYDPPTGRIS